VLLLALSLPFLRWPLPPFSDFELPGNISHLFFFGFSSMNDFGSPFEEEKFSPAASPFTEEVAVEDSPSRCGTKNPKPLDRSFLGLRCSRCENIFCDPVILHCGHDLCRTCTSETIECPICEVESSIEMFSEFSSNDPLKQMADAFKDFFAGKETLQQPPCCICGIEGKGRLFCSDCKTFCCVDCRNVHDAFPMTASHVLRELNSPEEVCQIHRENLQHYCLSCDAIICSTCGMESHRSCQTMKMSLAADRRRKIFTEILATPLLKEREGIVEKMKGLVAAIQEREIEIQRLKDEKARLFKEELLLLGESRKLFLQANSLRRLGNELSSIDLLRSDSYTRLVDLSKAIYGHQYSDISFETPPAPSPSNSSCSTSSVSSFPSCFSSSSSPSPCLAFSPTHAPGTTAISHLPEDPQFLFPPSPLPSTPALMLDDCSSFQSKPHQRPKRTQLLSESLPPEKRRRKGKEN
jgi:hypothetical protein